MNQEDKLKQELLADADAQAAEIIARAQEEAGKNYLDQTSFLQKSLVNIAKAGIFSADRAVLEYADRIWNMK